MDKYYYINSTNQQVGPVSPQDFKRYGINKNTLVWKQGMNNWMRAGLIPQLANYLQHQGTPQTTSKSKKGLMIGMAVFGVLLLGFIFLIVLANIVSPGEDAPDESEFIIVEDMQANDSIMMWKALAEEYMERGKEDAAYIKESIPLVRKRLQYTIEYGNEDAFSKYFREQELNGLNSKVELINSWLNQMFICYQKENYKGVMEYANAIEKQKLEIRKIIE